MTELHGDEQTARRTAHGPRDRLEPALIAVTGAALAVGGIAWLVGAETLADACWAAGTALAIIPSLAWAVSALRRWRAGVDLIAVLALAGTLATGEYLAGALIALMPATGRWLDAGAERRASHDLHHLLEHASRSARRRTGDQVRTVPLAEVRVGDLLAVGPGRPGRGLPPGHRHAGGARRAGRPRRHPRAGAAQWPAEHGGACGEPRWTARTVLSGREAPTWSGRPRWGAEHAGPPTTAA